MTGERQRPYPSSKNIAKRIRETSRPPTSPSVPEKIMEKILLETIASHMKDKKVSGNSQHGFKSKSCLTNPAAFYYEMTASSE